MTNQHNVSNWWMFHHDEAHTGVAGNLSSNIRSINIQQHLKPFKKISLMKTPNPVPGGWRCDIFSIPSIVDGKIYVGTDRTETGDFGGTLHKIDLQTGTKEASYTFSNPSKQGWGRNFGICSSPAIPPAGEKVYFFGMDCAVYCLDANHLGPNYVWRTDLRHADPPHHQPIDNSRLTPTTPGNKVNYQMAAYCSPLVFNGKVYVGTGNGEGDAYGFVYCLDANTGNVIWLYCTNKFPDVNDNRPNMIPTSVASQPLPTGGPHFEPHPDPHPRGASVWSSCAFAKISENDKRIYVGTGNQSPWGPLPGPLYSNGILALNADNGNKIGFYQQTRSDAYKPTDEDVDIPGSPTVFYRGNEQNPLICVGAKSGAFFILDKDLNKVAGRQLLPYDEQTHQPLPNIDLDQEDYSGVFGSAAIDFNEGRIFVGLGGPNHQHLGIQYNTTPFMRVLDWNYTNGQINDAWPTHIETIQIDNGTYHVQKYNNTDPLYKNAHEVTLGSPALINDVCFVGTSKPAFYAFNNSTGDHIWTAPDLQTEFPGGSESIFTFGPSIYNDFVVLGLQDNLYVYKWQP
jgi:outer membrane protein assembly factor BamB